MGGFFHWFSYGEGSTMTTSTSRPAAYTYTVRQLGTKVYQPFTGACAFVPTSSVDIINGGCVATVRRCVHGINRVVKQFPRFVSEADAHKAAQEFISKANKYG